MRSYGIPSKVINMVKALYADFECAVVDGHDTTEWFKIKTEVKQGYNMSGLLFLLVVDWVMRNTLQEGKTGIRWKFTTKLEDFHFVCSFAPCCEYLIVAKMTSQSWYDLINPAKAVNRDDIFTKIHVHCEHGTLFTDGKYKGFI